MSLGNYLIKRFLLRVKKFYLYMYMYLSDRIRRLFLSGPCPQNLSPKKPLSLKDQRFLQKALADKNLSRVLVKQQKLLYEKHIGGLLKEALQKRQDNCFALNAKQDDALNFPRKSLTLFMEAVKVKKKQWKKEKKTTSAKLLCSKEQLKSNQRGIFKQQVQSSKTAFKNENPLSSGFDINLLGLENLHVSLNVRKSSNLAKFADNYPLHSSTDFHEPLFVNGKSKYTNCRYLYDHESLKTCIVPQIFKNQKSCSPAKTLLQERKKIALLYGQLAKKDILSISRKALSIPGFFEDNMYTLLESRVDVCVFRAGFSKTIAGARQLIRNGSVLVNGKRIYSCKRKALPGDYFTFAFKQAKVNPYRNTTLELYRLCLSSQVLKEWVSVSKMKLFRERAFKQECYWKPIKKENKPLTFKNYPEWCLFQFSAIPALEKYKPAFYYSLYWGFFRYKLYKIPHFSSFLGTEKNSNLKFNTFKSNWKWSGINPRFSLFLGKTWLQSIMSQASLSKGCFTVFEKKKLKKKKENEKAYRRKKIVLLNLYTQLLLKKLNNLQTKKKTPRLFKKKISSSNLWAIWGQKPLHLEISHKTGAFIYMYKPQKVISSVCLDFKL